MSTAARHFIERRPDRFPDSWFCSEIRTAEGLPILSTVIEAAMLVLLGCYMSVRLPSLGEGAGRYSFE
jgi:hypothetical protein